MDFDSSRPAMLELTALPLAARQAVVDHSKRVAGVLRLVSTGWRNATDEAVGKLWLQHHRGAPARPVSALLSLARRCANVTSVDLYFYGGMPLLDLAPTLSALWRLPKLKVRSERSGRSAARAEAPGLPAEHSCLHRAGPPCSPGGLHEAQGSSMGLEASGTWHRGTGAACCWGGGWGGVSRHRRVW